MGEVRSLHVGLAEASSQAASFTFNDRRSRRDEDDTDDGHSHGHDTDDSQGSYEPVFATVHHASSRSHPTHRFAASLHTPFQGPSTGLPSPPETAQRPLSSNGVYPTAARARPLSNGQLGTASSTPARITPLRRVNLVESRSSINRIGATSSPLTAGVHLKNGAFGGSYAGTHQSPFPAPTSKKWLVMVKGPAILPHSPPPNDASGFARAYGASGRYDGGVLMPLQNSLSAQVALIAREFSLPSIGGVALYLCLNNSTNITTSVPMARRTSRATSASLSTAPDDVSSRPASMLSTNEYHEPEMFKPRILEETWGTLWAAFLDPLGVVGESVQGPFGASLAIAGILEFDIDPRRAHWLANCYSSSDPNDHHSTPVVQASSRMSTPTLSTPQLRHVPRGSEVAHRALQGNRGGSQVGRRGRSVSYVWHQPEEQEQRSTTPARSTDEEVPHELVRSTLGGHFGDRDDSNFDPRLGKSLEGSERGSFGRMMLRDMNDVGFEDEDQDSEEPDSDVPSDITSHDDSLTTDVEVLHDLRTVEVGTESGAFESFDHFLTSTPGPSSSANRQLSTQDRDGTGSPRLRRETRSMSCCLETLAEQSSLDEHDPKAFVEYGQAMTSIEAVSDLHQVALLDLSQKKSSPQVSMSDGEQASSGNKSTEDFEGEDLKCSAENVQDQSSSLGEGLDLLHGDAPSESAAVVDDPRTAAHQTPPSTALELTNKLTSAASVTYPYFQLYPPHPPYFVSATKTPSTPSSTRSFSKLMSSPKRRGAPPSPLQFTQHRTDDSVTKTKEVPEEEDKELHVRDDPQKVTEGGQPWDDETTPQDAIFADYAQVSPSGYDGSTSFPEPSDFPQEIDLDQVDQAKLKEVSHEESGLLLSASPRSTSSSSGSSVSTTFERALKTSGHRNVLSLGESDTGSDIMPLSALFRPPPSGHFDSAFDFQPSPIATTNFSIETSTSPNRRPPSPTLNATELNSTSSNISAFVRAMGHPDDGIPFALPTQGTDHSSENPLEFGDDSMDSIDSMGTDKLAVIQTSFDLHQGIPAEGLLVGIGAARDDNDDDDDEDEDSDDDGIGLGEDQSCRIFDHLPSSPLPAVLEAEMPKMPNSSPQHLPTAAVEA